MAGQLAGGLGTQRQAVTQRSTRSDQSCPAREIKVVHTLFHPPAPFTKHILQGDGDHWLSGSSGLPPGDRRHKFYFPRGRSGDAPQLTHLFRGWRLSRPLRTIPRRLLASGSFSLMTLR